MILVAYILYDVICVSATRSIAGTKGVDGQWSTDIPRNKVDQGSGGLSTEDRTEYLEHQNPIVIVIVHP